MLCHTLWNVQSQDGLTQEQIKLIGLVFVF